MIFIDPDGEFILTAALIAAGIGMGLDYCIQVAMNYANNKTGWDAWFNDVDFFDVAVSGVISGVTAGYGATLNAGGKISKFGQFVMSNQGWIKAGEIALTSAVDITGEGAQPVTFDQFKNRVSIAAVTWGTTEVVSNVFSPSKTPTLEQNVDNSIEKARKSLNGEDFRLNPNNGLDLNSKDLLNENSQSTLENASDAALNASKNNEIFIKNKHLNIGSGRYSKFNTNNISEVKGFVKEALNSSKAVFKPNNLSNTFIIEADIGRVIGTRGQIKIRAIVGFDDSVINAFPIK